MPRNAITPSIGPFSAAVQSAGFIFLSGQVALDPATGKLIAGDVSAQTEQIFRNVGAVLDAAGKGFADVVKTLVFLSDMKDFAAMNAVYARHFAAPFPARTTIAVAGLPLGAAVEIEVLVGP
jgi:2-iminobutanoate/2-iminopropanoate deaminase